MSIEKTVALIECYEHLENALNETLDIDLDDERITGIQLEIKSVIESVNKHIKEMNK